MKLTSAPEFHLYSVVTHLQLKVEAINRFSLRGWPLSTNTNAGKDYELSIMDFTRHFL